MCCGKINTDCTASWIYKKRHITSHPATPARWLAVPHRKPHNAPLVCVWCSAWATRSMRVQVCGADGGEVIPGALKLSRARNTEAPWGRPPGEQSHMTDALWDAARQRCDLWNRAVKVSALLSHTLPLCLQDLSLLCVFLGDFLSSLLHFLRTFSLNNFWVK